MVEEVLQEPEQQQEPTQQDPPKKRLWSKLSGSKLYTKSYEDFEKQFSTPESKSNRKSNFYGWSK